MSDDQRTYTPIHADELQHLSANAMPHFTGLRSAIRKAFPNESDKAEFATAIFLAMALTSTLFTWEYISAPMLRAVNVAFHDANLHLEYVG
jgi:hypothetical protein